MKNDNRNEQPWYKGKVGDMIREVLRGLFSLSFFKAVFSSLAYFIHEHVIWRMQVHASGIVRVHARASLRNAKNIFLGDNVRITIDCCIWAESHSTITIGNNVLVGQDFYRKPWYCAEWHSDGSSKKN